MKRTKKKANKTRKREVIEIIDTGSFRKLSSVVSDIYSLCSKNLYSNDFRTPEDIVLRERLDIVDWLREKVIQIPPDPDTNASTEAAHIVWGLINQLEEDILKG